MVISDRQMGHLQSAAKSGALSCRLMHSCSAMDRHMQHAVFHTIEFLAFSCLAFSASPFLLSLVQFKYSIFYFGWWEFWVNFSIYTPDAKHIHFCCPCTFLLELFVPMEHIDIHPRITAALKRGEGILVYKKVKCTLRGVAILPLLGR